MPALLLGMLVLLPFVGHMRVVRRLLGSQLIRADERTDRGADCFFDVGMATTSLAQAVTTIKKATRDCPKDPNDEGKCPLDITEIFVLFAETAAYFSSGISECPSVHPTDMMCESRLAKFLSSIGDIAVAAQQIHQECVRVHHKQQPHRRLQEAGLLANVLTNASGSQNMLTNPAQMPANASLIAHCTIKASSAAFMLGKATVDISKAVRNCPKAGNMDAGDGPALKCAVAWQSTIGALGTVASTLASVALECAQSINIQQRCGIDVARLITALVEVGASATGMQLDCVWRDNSTA